MVRTEQKCYFAQASIILIPYTQINHKAMLVKALFGCLACDNDTMLKLLLLFYQ